MKRASYREAVQWIALNDDASTFDADDIAASVTVRLAACLFEKEPEDVAKAVLKVRSKEWPEDAKRYRAQLLAEMEPGDEKLSEAQLDALGLATPTSCVFAGANHTSSGGIHRVSPSVIHSLIKRGLLMRVAHDTLAARLTPAGAEARRCALIDRGQL